MAVWGVAVFDVAGPDVAVPAVRVLVLVVVTGHRAARIDGGRATVMTLALPLRRPPGSPLPPPLQPHRPQPRLLSPPPTLRRGRRPPAPPPGSIRSPA